MRNWKTIWDSIRAAAPVGEWEVSFPLFFDKPLPLISILCFWGLQC
jgi:hypothetical protein